MSRFFFTARALLAAALLAAAASCAITPMWQQDDSWGEPIERVQMRLAIAADGAPSFPGDLPAMEVQIRNQGINAVTVNPEALIHAQVEIDGVWYSQAFATFGSAMPRVIEPGSQSEVFQTFQYVHLMNAMNGSQPSTPSLDLRPGPHRVRLRNLTGTFGVHTIDGRNLALISNRIVFGIPEMPEAAALVAQLGLTTDVEAERPAVNPGDPLALRLTFRNESTNAFRLPHTLAPPTWQLWVLKLRAAIAAIENDPVPLWRGGEARSDETQIVVRGNAGPQ